MVSFDDPRFVDYLSKQGSPEAAEMAWAQLTGASEVFRQVDQQMAALLQANPDLPMNRVQYIAEAEKARLRSQAPGLGALQVAKQRLAQSQEIDTSTFTSLSAPEKRMVRDLMVTKQVPLGEALNLFSQKNPPAVSDVVDKANSDDLFRGLGGSRSSTSGGAEPPAAGPTDQLVGSLRDANTRVKALGFMRDNPEATDQAVKSAMSILNTDDVVVDEKNPDSIVEADSIRRKKGEAKIVVDALTELQARGESPVVVANKDNFIGAAAMSINTKKPVFVELPNGKWEYRAFKDEAETRAFLKEKFEPVKKSDPGQEKAQAGYLPEDKWYKKLKRATGFGESTDEVDARLAYWKAQYADESKPIEERTDALLSIKELEGYRTTAKRDAVMEEYLDLNRQKDRLESLANNPVLSKDEKAPIIAELAVVKSRLEEQEKNEAVSRWNSKDSKNMNPVADWFLKTATGQKN